ncbi:MAG: hypothetical protein L6R39_006199 [Caloplaca ligustica]|nr:MAG: hypothetical protein L6R39_006199 [Caloplaca ligustica]
MPAPGGDFLARALLGNTIVDEVDYRQRAAVKAWNKAGKDFRAMRAQDDESPLPSRSHYSSEVANTGRSLQRRGTVRDGGRDTRNTQGGGGLSRRDTVGHGGRDSTRAGAGESSERLILDPYNVRSAAAGSRRTIQQGGDGPVPASSRRTVQPDVDGSYPDGYFTQQLPHLQQQHGRSQSVPRGGSIRSSRARGGEEMYHGHSIMEVTPRR